MVIVAFQPGEKYAVNYTTLDQYDYGQLLRIQGLKLPKTVEVHFSTQEIGGTSITRVGVTKDGVTDVLIPDSVLENGDTTQNYSIFAFAYITDATSGKTEYRARLEVKARPKPEVPGGGDNPDIFHEAVLEVRESAEKAEEAQKQAEGYAHGREDLPERAEDNAMYYAGKASEDAKKTAQDRAEVERLTESNTQIQGEVAKDLEEVENLSSQAQASATNAALSEQKSKEAATRAEIAQTGAETAEDNAELAAQKTGQDKTAVEQARDLVQQMGQEVLNNKNAVDGTAQDFALNAQQAIADVNNSGQTQTERVQTAGTTAVENIKTAQNTATQAVETAKTEAVKAVADKGKEILEAIPDFNAKLDKNQGTEHAGKALVIGEDGNVVPGKPQIEGVGDAADAIVETVSGTLLNIKDSAERKNKGFGMVGKTEQETTTGAQLFDENTVTRGIINRDTGEVGVSNSYSTSDYISVVPKKQYSINSFASYHFCYYSPDKKHISAGDNTSTFTVPDNVAYIRFSFTTDKLKEIILCEGSKLLPYEPYTGGKPSPSPEYPQEILNAGQLNEDTGKYEVDVRVTGKNLIDEIALKNFENYTKQGIVYYVYRIRGLVTGAQYTLSRGKVSSGNKMIFGISTNGQSYDNSSFLIYDGLNNNYNRESITWIQNNNDYADILFSYNSNSSQTTEERLKELFDRVEYIQLEYGKNATVHEVFREPQTLTLTSDRPLTKWDRLVEQEGQIGWLYKSSTITFTGKPEEKWRIHGGNSAFYIEIENANFQNSLCDKYRHRLGAWSESDFCIYSDNKYAQKYFRPPYDGFEMNVDTWKRFLNENPLTVEYETLTSEFIPLPQEQQEAIRALQTYYPTTVVSNSENMEMELSYVADTKNYTDRKIEEAVSAQTQNLANLLSLMPLSTQAAMIEADTNNILDMEVQK